MSHSKHHYLALLPLLSILSISPARPEQKMISRGIASTLDLYPEYEKAAGRVEVKSLMPDKDITIEKFAQKGEDFRQKLLQAEKDFDNHADDFATVSKQKNQLDDLVIDMVLLDQSFNQLKDKKAFDKDGEEIADGTVKELKGKIDQLLVSLKTNKLKVQNRLSAESEKISSLDKEEVKKDEETEKPSENPEICELQEKNKALSKQVEDLLADQKKINESILNLTQTMTQMVQNQNPWAQYMYGPQMPNFYQYPAQQGPQYNIPNLSDQSEVLKKLDQQQQSIQMLQQQLQQMPQQMPQQMSQQYLPQPFMINNGLGLSQSIQVPVAPSQGDSSYLPLYQGAQFQVGSFGGPINSSLANSATNFSYTGLMM